MSDVDEDFMCEDDEDYGLVSVAFGAIPQRVFAQCRRFVIISQTGILGRQQLGAGCGSGEPVLQQQGIEGRLAERGPDVVPEGAGS